MSDPAAEHARRASSFGSAAAAYAAHRPDYPAAAIAWALEPLGGRPRRILDLGAGTGKLTAQLTGLAEVVAVEPDPQMLAELRARLPGVAALAGRAEDIPLPDASVDAVLAGQAAHWFDLNHAVPEIARVLTHGGVVAGLWNVDDDRVDWVAGLHRVTGRENVASFSAFTARNEEPASSWLGTAASSRLFRRHSRAWFGHAQVRTAESLIETIRTHSVFLTMEPDRRETELARVREYLAGTAQTASGEFSLPICTYAARAVCR
jgi:SAM-dependent methyltransferase